MADQERPDTLAAPAEDSATRYQRAVDLILENRSSEDRKAFWDYVDGRITIEEFEIHSRG
jgi:hypothetical protein